MAEFAYNNSVNRPIGRSSFEIVTGIKARLTIYLSPLPIEAGPNREVEDVHDEVRK